MKFHTVSQEGPADHEGTEDPRVVLFDGVYYLLYTAVNHNDTTGGANAHLALATTGACCRPKRGGGGK